MVGGGGGAGGGGCSGAPPSGSGGLLLLLLLLLENPLEGTESHADLSDHRVRTGIRGIMLGQQVERLHNHRQVDVCAPFGVGICKQGQTVPGDEQWEQECTSSSGSGSGDVVVVVVVVGVDW